MNKYELINNALTNLNSLTVTGIEAMQKITQIAQDIVTLNRLLQEEDAKRNEEKEEVYVDERK